MVVSGYFVVFGEPAQHHVYRVDDNSGVLSDLFRGTRRFDDAPQRRTAMGVDFEGTPWAPYAPKSREKGTVTLGDLAKCIEHEVDSTGITLAITGDKRQIAEYHNDGTRRTRAGISSMSPSPTWN